MIGGLMLALCSAALINIGFLLQHRGLRRSSGNGLLRQLRRALRDRVWLSGQAIGWIGFAAQIVAVAIAPLSLVQAFAAGGLALSVPVAAWMFRHHITRTQMVAVLVMAAALAVLPIGFSTARDHVDTGALVLATAVGTFAALGVARVPAAWARAIAAGVFYGLADAAIKAVSLAWSTQGVSAVISGWTVVAAAGTFAGFLAFQSSLQGDGPVAAISLMNGLAALAALVCGVVAFGESLGVGPIAATAHLVAITVVLAGVPVMAAAQTEIAESGETRRRQVPRANAFPPLAQRVR
jgi:Magnesium transporter NIPA